MLSFVFVCAVADGSRVNFYIKFPVTRLATTKLSHRIPGAARFAVSSGRIYLLKHSSFLYNVHFQTNNER